jgi:putative transposase
VRQADEGTAIAEVCRKVGISEATCYNWRKKYGGLMPPEMRRLKQVEEENVKLKRIMADLAFDKEMLHMNVVSSDFEDKSSNSNYIYCSDFARKDGSC